MAMSRRLSVRSLKDINDSCTNQSFTSLNSSNSHLVFSPRSSISSEFRTPLTPFGAVVFFPKSASQQRKLSLTSNSPASYWITPPQKLHRLEIPKAPMRRSIDVGELSRHPELEQKNKCKLGSQGDQALMLLNLQSSSYQDIRQDHISTSPSGSLSFHTQPLNSILFWSPSDDVF